MSLTSRPWILWLGVLLLIGFITCDSQRRRTQARSDCAGVQLPPEWTRERLVESLEADSTHSGDMMKWTVLIIAGTIASVISTSRLSPRSTNFRLAYLLFPIAWTLLILSLFEGTNVKSGYLASLSSGREYWGAIGACANSAMLRQGLYMTWGASVLGLWLLIFLHWWIFYNPADAEQKKWRSLTNKRAR